MFTQKPKNQVEKIHNSNIDKIANQILMHRLNELNKPEVYDEYEKSILREKAKSETSFIVFFKELVKKKSGTNLHNWKATLSILRHFV